MSVSPGPALRIGNCSGFYGDRLSAMREQLDGAGENGQSLDVLTGDYLAELTMLILGRDQLKDASLGYARTFVRQVEDCLGLALESGVKIVSNAGGLNPAGLADRLREVAHGLGLDPAITHVEGDDVRHLASVNGWSDGTLTANAYLGGFGIAAALRAGADVVVTGRVTDASLVVGPAIAHHGWTSTSYDELAGAVVAGHVIECGAQATGGNFSGFTSLPRSARALGFPIAEVAADGSSIITKHHGTGGAVTVDTVTAQLVYEIQSERYLGPDVTARLDTIELAQEAPDRVAITGVRGEAPPEQLKICLNELGGWRNSVDFVLTGLEIEAKAAWVRKQLTARISADEVTWSEVVAPPLDAETEQSASALLRCTVKDASPDPVGRPFTSAAVELALSSYPGFTMTAPPAPATPYGIYRAALIGRAQVTQTVVHADGRREEIVDATEFGGASASKARRPSPFPAPNDVLTRRMPLGTFVHARSGDKGGDANLGLWVAHDGVDQTTYDARVQWLFKVMSARRVRELVPEAADLDVDVWLLPNIGAVNVVIHGLLGDGVAASTRFDPQAKGLGEWVRSRTVSIDQELV